MLPFAPRPALAARVPPSLLRRFSCTPAPGTKTIKPHLLPDKLIPPYPYGERRVYKQSNTGLYGLARIRFGNTVAPKHNRKARRFWRPNVHVKVLHCPSFGANVRTRLTLRVLKTIRREGGLENYLLGRKPARVKELGPGGWNLRWLLCQTRAVQERWNEERRRLGLEEKPVVDNDKIIAYALDVATPGPLNVPNRAMAAGYRANRGAVFALGPDVPAGEEEAGEELTDEAEAELLAELDKEDAAAAARTENTKTHKLEAET
ncbi:hypothetical protein S7711_02053 [Stachybotrys chartarum IBT 7711]|uniref:Ribosomal protein L28 n=1 Tax=Stachybotrys chartarum (strain CBS 109288 / IBT 7711) TaxID=1280523 RepID=A0A084AW37_STACB|nr:hypothetical protein S7711_02053 [Stachybotrys chartarum IBT 7711]KFA53264.1 hypothetical protein S40293_04687 [Stachybotrys chartarum IBT 40293]KFA78253.1 hypothetical protein S40288_02626 [Stachybotrys chartarum IBT 40288]